MVSTTLRDAPPLAWPALRRAGGVKLVYLDQKDWVHLAQADTGHRDGTRYAAALRAARDARAAGTTVFPLSLTHYSETLKATAPAADTRPGQIAANELHPSTPSRSETATAHQGGGAIGYPAPEDINDDADGRTAGTRPCR